MGLITGLQYRGTVLEKMYRIAFAQSPFPARSLEYRGLFFTTAHAAVVEDPFSDPDGSAGPIDNLFGGSTSRAATRLRAALLPFHNKAGVEVPVPQFTRLTPTAWCNWFEELTLGGGAPYALCQLREKLKAD